MISKSTIAAIANLPTRYGNFQVVSFSSQNKKEHAAIIKGDVTNKNDVVTRIHSECLTGDVMGSLRCDCQDQLTHALKTIGKLKTGILLYLRQEGRGIGFINKIKAYSLQDHGLDTFEADKELGFSGDERDYAVAAQMLSSLKVKSICLITNSPSKVKNLEKHGVKITGIISLIIKPNKFNRFYLQTKEKKAGHLLEQQE